MDELLEECRKLNRYLKESREYRAYAFARISLQSHPELYKQTMELKKKYSDVEKFTDGNPYDELRRLYDDNDALLHNSVVNDYLRAENDFIRLVRKVIAEIADGLMLSES